MWEDIFRKMLHKCTLNKSLPLGGEFVNQFLTTKPTQEIYLYCFKTRRCFI